MSEPITLKPKDYLLHEGDTGEEMYYVQSGNLGIYKRKGDTEVQIGTIGTGELVGEMSFLDKQPRSATVKAMTDTVLIVIPFAKLQSTLDASPKWLGALFRTLTERLRKANSKMRI
jgi:CRP/FNR family transcriptional regulator, cyclic AMP receptor protein